MKKLPSLTVTGIAVLAITWAYAAPPRVTGNRPVTIQVPVPDDDPAPPAKKAAPGSVLAAAQPTEGKGAPEQPDSPEGALKRSRELLLRYSSINARLVETVSFFDRSYKAEGRYLQTSLKPGDWHMRLELMLKVGGSEGALLEVCDGEILWTRTEIGAGKKKDQTITRRDVGRILAAAKKLGDPKTENSIIANLGLGGLPALLASIERDMKFSSLKEETLRDRPVVVLSGQWNDAFKGRFGVEPSKGPALLPSFVPDEVQLSLDRETAFPVRFLYLKKIEGRDVLRPILTLDFIDVALNQPVDNSEFAYEPPQGITPVELTNFYLDQLAPPSSAPPPPR